MIQTSLRVLLFVAVGCLVLNDVARLICPALQQAVLVLDEDSESEEEGIPFSSSNLLEEEVKHSTSNPLPRPVFLAEECLSKRIAHRIQDDDIPVLAFIAIFSPPPDRA